MGLVIMQLLHHTDFFFEINKTINIMRLEKWFISNLDDSQRNIIVQNIDKDIAVQGAAGSGKTNLAIHRALQAIRG